jgi:hypothetical protein
MRLLPAVANVAMPAFCHPWSAGRWSDTVADGAVLLDALIKSTVSGC